MNPILARFVSELREIANQADRERLSVWIDQFKMEFPELHDDLVTFREMPSAELALAYLIAKDIRFAGIKLFPGHMNWIRFVHNYMRERAGINQAPRARRKLRP